MSAQHMTALRDELEKSAQGWDAAAETFEQMGQTATAAWARQHAADNRAAITKAKGTSR